MAPLFALLAPVGSAVAGGASAVGGAVASGVSAMGGMGSVMSAGGSLLSGFSSIMGGIQDKNEAEANIEIAKYNTAQEKAETLGKFSEVKGKQRTGYGSAGVDLTSGSPLLIAEYTAFQEKRELDSEKYEYEMKKNALKHQGKQALVGGIIKGASTFMSGLGKSQFLG